MNAWNTWNACILNRNTLRCQIMHSFFKFENCALEYLNLRRDYTNGLLVFNWITNIEMK